MFTLWNAKHIPLGLALWDFCSACLADRSDCIGEDRLNLLNRSDVIALGFGDSLSRYPIRLHQLIKKVRFLL